MEEQKITTPAPAANVAEQAGKKEVKGPKALFWYLTLFFTLALTAFNTGGLWFQYINKWFPKEITGGIVRQSFDQSALKFAIAGLLVAVPLFFLLNWLIRKSLKNGRLHPENKIRVWTTYIILFLTIAIAVGDLITTVFKVLDGDYTLRFLLKAFTILFIVSWIFIYYGMELKSPNSLVGSKLPKTMMIVTIIIILISFIGAFFIVDSPAMARAKAYDRTIENDLRQIMYSIDNYYNREGEMPQALSDIPSNEKLFLDPDTSVPYDYRVISGEKYELCATFKTSNQQQDGNYTDRYYNYDYEFAHDAGKKCFELSANDRSIKNPELIREPVPLPIKD